MKKIVLFLFMALELMAGDYIKKYGFEFGDNAYHLAELKDGQKGAVCLGKICELNLLYAEGNRTFTGFHNGENNEATNVYENNLFFLPDVKLILGSLERKNLNEDLNSSTTKEAFDKLLQDKKVFLENEELNYYGNEVSQELNITKLTKDRIFFRKFVDYSYSGAAHPSFYTSGFSLDTKTMELKTYILSDVIEDSEEFRKFITEILREYLSKNKEYWADWDKRNYFSEDKFGFNLLKQEIVFMENGLYINLRYLLSEAGRNLDFFEVPYKELKTFAKGDLKQILEK
ncbi:hypothetical protein CHLV4142_06830 [Campylobacter helveticus]|uniref:DUF3298 domain-containing protein n=2 Tax=Campylobacter helveticus TaxID=28898 RepID=A0ABY3L1D4_9BACT|nr:hypothetical protein [Campylobacter helveticus]MCR2039867.1 hypothetical protein [Campylobacter helveticus]TNB60224.1 hypothetical protein FDR72_06660 [Campylobacter helveticus]TXK56624.1 hypothetical protein FVD16_06580 [Campylobacter helveticus]